jgi:pSer/pThr/pTyr-binding forkhead associated (FHA) protein
MITVTLVPGDVIAAGTARFRYLDDAEMLEAFPREVVGHAEGDAEAHAAHLIDEAAQGAYPLSQRTITIGRDTSSVIRLKDPRVSRYHADIRAEAGVYVLHPLGASGTYVNHERITAPRVLEEGDRIEIGGTALRFTRAPLPDEVHPADAEWELNDPQAMRATLLHGAVTAREDAVPEGPSRLWLLAAAAVLLAIVGYLVFI